ncbi:MAG: CdaR family protein [Syntrophomonadaceae bacterium]|nr:CdaR family protein [Syntrophomonadaceae bacterium]
MPKKTRGKYGLIALSVLMALLLWFYVINQQNAGNTQNTVQAELNYVNAGAEYTVEGPDSVSVSMWGAAVDSSQIWAYVDLSGLSEGEHTLKVNVQPVPGALFTSVNPNEVTVNLAGAEEKELRITRELIGAAAPGAELGEVVLSTERCIVRGDSAALAAVATVVAPIIIEGVSGVLNQEVVLQARDADGAVLHGVTLLPNQVQVMAVAQRHLVSREAVVELVSEGELPEGYELGDIELEPEQVNLIGYSDQLQNISYIPTAALSLEGRTESFTTYLQLQTPAGVKASPSQLLVTVNIFEPESAPVSGMPEIPGDTESDDEPPVTDEPAEGEAQEGDGDSDEAGNS